MILVTSTIAPHDIANDDWEDDSVAGGAGGDGVSARRTWSRQRIEGVERDKWGHIIRACWIIGCQYRTGTTSDLKNHKASKHGINVVWLSCDQENCDYNAKQAGCLKKHKRDIHNIDVVWHRCDSCDYKSKQAGDLNGHKQYVHNIGVVWHQCDSCEYKAKQAGNLKTHTNKVFTTLASLGTNAIHANSFPSEQATSMYTNNETTKTTNTALQYKSRVQINLI
ncbi:hypothetical protein TrLO_g6734 [Triparma laevis f. longispina]|uniref:C2H2-type domain-containing protein n=1 Tax=Triparma laevis f. longispina TaxID=1714387 RepID=A0A9W7FNQ2_9STRA|nr:hypothetical protein TrLO_g6734 [Triparma laevis f. longispina]